MATLTLNLELISGAVDQQQVRAGLDAARDTLCRVLDELRKLGAAIYPPVLASAGLRPALLAVAEHRDLTLRLDLPRHDLSREARTRTGLLLADHLLTLSPGTTVVVRVRGRRLVRVWITEERPGQSHRRRHRAVLRCG